MSTDDCKKDTQKIQIHQQTFMGMAWFGAWLFTIGYLQAEFLERRSGHHHLALLHRRPRRRLPALIARRSCAYQPGQAANCLLPCRKLREKCARVAGCVVLAVLAPQIANDDHIAPATPFYNAVKLFLLVIPILRFRPNQHRAVAQNRIASRRHTQAPAFRPARKSESSWSTDQART